MRLRRLRIALSSIQYDSFDDALRTGVDKGGQGAQPPPNCWAEKNFFVKIEGLLEPVVLDLRFRVRFNAIFTSERRY